jgi:hypothetical protein
MYPMAVSIYYFTLDKKISQGARKFSRIRELCYKKTPRTRVQGAWNSLFLPTSHIKLFGTVKRELRQRS